MALGAGQAPSRAAFAAIGNDRAGAGDGFVEQVDQFRLASAWEARTLPSVPRTEPNATWTAVLVDGPKSALRAAAKIIRKRKTMRVPVLSAGDRDGSAKGTGEGQG
jgi:hypothetical protein